MLAFTPDNWQSHPCVNGRPAIEQDVIENRATFYVPNSTVEDVASLHCPLPGVLKNSDGETVPALILQAQISPTSDTYIIGAIDQSGQHYVTTSDDVEVLTTPTSDWMAKLETSQ